ncbi:MaoC/PaaZ C-terminal domain-containing protein [Nocardioides sp. LHD-245]|uniref:MaoC family dehydratase n=1 Tax=Nocardioides sp. LHD-245 TaxID=3051387 RepID=UPI0027E03BCA|nr:MaoC/PaaZ C-terminal domain-containing protein [Nocardioides sp. LHD-245]
MPLDPTRVGLVTGPHPVTWTDKDSLLYALAVGAGQDDPLAELALTTENSEGVAQQVIPTFGVVLGLAHGLPDVGDFDPTRAVHAEQEFVVDGPIPAAGEAHVVTTVTEIWDKDPHAVMWTESELVDAATGRRLMRSRLGAFFGGAGGFGGERGPSPAWSAPERSPDLEIDFASRPDQALLYRLTGDRNPLHADPVFAARGGFDRPILHGMCTYGCVARLLVNRLAGGDASALRAMAGRFTRPVLPGDALRLVVWRDGEEGVFRVLTPAGDVVIDRGRFELDRPEAAQDARA